MSTKEPAAPESDSSDDAVLTISVAGVVKLFAVDAVLLVLDDDCVVAGVLGAGTVVLVGVKVLWPTPKPILEA